MPNFPLNNNAIEARQTHFMWMERRPRQYRGKREGVRLKKMMKLTSTRILKVGILRPMRNKNSGMYRGGGAGERNL